MIVRVLFVVLALLFTVAAPGEALAQGCDAGFVDIGDGASGVPQCVPDPNTAGVAVEQNNALNQGGAQLISVSNGNGGVYCFTCLFAGNFMVALGSFAVAVFTFLASFFTILAPIMIAIWVAYKTVILAFAGGEGGGQFLVSVVKKSTLFFFVWMVMTSTNTYLPKPGDGAAGGEAPWAYQMAGVEAAGMAFDLAGDIRTEIAETDTRMNCDNAFAGSGFESEDRFASSATAMVCAVERVHIIGIATAWQMITGTWNALSVNAGWDFIQEFVSGFFGAIVLTIFGLVLLTIYAVAIGFLITRIILLAVTILFLAGFSPLLALALLFAPSRKYAYAGLATVVGAMGSALAIGLALVMSYSLILSTPTAYNMAIEMSEAYKDLEPVDVSVPLQVQMSIMVNRFGIDPEDERMGAFHIPIGITTPWLWHFMLVGFAVFALSRKIIGIIEGIIGAPGSEQDAATAGMVGGMAGAGMKMALMATGGMALGGAAYRAMGGNGDSVVGRMSSTFGVASNLGKGTNMAVKGAARAYRAAGGKDMAMAALNPFGAYARAARMARGMTGEK